MFYCPFLLCFFFPLSLTVHTDIYIKTLQLGFILAYPEARFWGVSQQPGFCLTGMVASAAWEAEIGDVQTQGLPGL